MSDAAQAHIVRLQRMPVFGALRDDSLQLLLSRARSIAVRAGERFFREGDPARSMFVLEAGAVEILKSWQGREFVLHVLAGGDCFGEMALMDLSPRSASVRATTDCSALEFGSDDLLALHAHDVEQFALIQMNIGREVCRRLRATDELLFRGQMGEALPRPLPSAGASATIPPP